jgi:hypothetical protein
MSSCLGLGRTGISTGSFIDIGLKTDVDKTDVDEERLVLRLLLLGGGGWCGVQV